MLVLFFRLLLKRKDSPEDLLELKDICSGPQECLNKFKKHCKAVGKMDCQTEGPVCAKPREQDRAWLLGGVQRCSLRI